MSYALILNVCTPLRMKPSDVVAQSWPTCSHKALGWDLGKPTIRNTAPTCLKYTLQIRVHNQKRRSKRQLGSFFFPVGVSSALNRNQAHGRLITGQLPRQGAVFLRCESIHRHPSFRKGKKKFPSSPDQRQITNVKHDKSRKIFTLNFQILH